MTKEEYEKQLIRLRDSLRECKGSNDCAGVPCYKFPFNEKVCIVRGTVYNAYKAMEIVEGWAKDHPIKTNANKFKEVFGIDAPMRRCIKDGVLCVDCEYYESGSERGVCKVEEKFWDAEYKPTKEGEE